MTTVAIVPIETVGGPTFYQAVSGDHVAEGQTAGQALDALTSQFPEVAADALFVVQRRQPDEYFSIEQQLRLNALMERWRAERDRGDSLSATEQAELESLVDAEVMASGRRAAAFAAELGR